jgi:D-glycero-D-manno-heptose 1,7-bisphosphate phosphatase
MLKDDIQLLILDKDGTVVRSAQKKKYITLPYDQELFPEAEILIKQAVEKGVKVVINSNQAGVFSKYKTLDNVIKEMEFCQNLLNGLVQHAIFCPDYEAKSAWVVDTKNGVRVIKESSAAEGYFRKPNIGMLVLAMYLSNVYSLDKCLVVGDRDEDVDAASNAGINFMSAEMWHSTAKLTSPLEMSTTHH